MKFFLRKRWVYLLFFIMPLLELGQAIVTADDRAFKSNLGFLTFLTIVSFILYVHDRDKEDK